MPAKSSMAHRSNHVESLDSREVIFEVIFKRNNSWKIMKFISIISNVAKSAENFRAI